MDGNKDEAERCMELALKYIKEQNREKAEKFLHKAERLFPTQKAKDLLMQLNLMAPQTPEPQTDQPRRRNVAPKVEEPPVVEYTIEQAESVRRIKKCKDYYEILGVSKDATDSEIKKSYKKLALQLHPDKNKYPGAAEAFKAIGNAAAVLTDTEKRKQYDLFGSDEDRMARAHQRNSASSYTRGFESDATAEELFNMFFGGNLNGVYVRTGRRWQRHTTTNNSETHNHREQQSTYSAFIQILPIILAIVLSMASSFMVSDSAYSLQHTAKYPVLRRTHNLDIPYYVKENFASEYQGSVRRLEMSVEEEYISNLRHACYREKNYPGDCLSTSSIGVSVGETATNNCETSGDNNSDKFVSNMSVDKNIHFNINGALGSDIKPEVIHLFGKPEILETKIYTKPRIIWPCHPVRSYRIYGIMDKFPSSYCDFQNIKLFQLVN